MPALLICPRKETACLDLLKKLMKNAVSIKFLIQNSKKPKKRFFQSEAGTEDFNQMRYVFHGFTKYRNSRNIVKKLYEIS